MEMGNDLNKYKWIVYQTTCLVNNKIYVGVHKTKNPDVFDGYIGCGIEIGYTIKNTNNAYLRALKKYGYKNFVRTTIKIFDNEDDAYKLEEEIVDWNFIKRRDTYNTCLGGRHGNHYKKFYQYDLDGNFIKEWFSRESIIEHYNMHDNKNGIRFAIDKKYSMFNSYWTDEYVEHLDISDYRLNTFTTIYKVDFEGNIIAEYESAVKASEENNIPLSSIYDALHKKCPLKDHYWTKDASDIFNIIKLSDLNGISDKTISIYTSDKKLFKSFVSRKKLVSYLNVSDKEVRNAIKNETPINGYLIQYGFYDTFGNHKMPGIKVEQWDLDGNLVKTWNTIAECAKEHPKVRLVLKGIRKQTHGYTFNVI